MQFVKPLPFAEALDKLGQRVVVASKLDSEFRGADVCAVLGFTTHQERLSRLPDNCRSDVTISDIRSEQDAPRKRGENIRRNVTIISAAGVMRLAFRSNKPEAQAFVDWLVEVVLPQIAKYGVYVAGSDPAERCTLLWHQWKLERAKEIAVANADLEARGLTTIALFAELNQVELRDVLSFARLASQEAIAAGEARSRFYTRTGMRRAYSDAVLRAALARLQPQLPFAATAQAAAQ